MEVSSASLSGHVVVIIGASSGVGYETARIFARAGAIVVAAARRLDRLNRLKAELAIGSIHIDVRQVDVTIIPDINRLVQSVMQEFSRVDILVYASGTNVVNRKLADLDEQSWRSVLDVNLNGCLRATQAVLPYMRAAGSGRLIYVSSIAAAVPDFSGAAYQMTKRAIVGLAHAVRMEEQACGISASVILPGLVDTEILQKRPEPVAPDVLAKALKPVDVGLAILFMATAPRHMVVTEMHLLPAAL